MSGDVILDQTWTQVMLHLGLEPRALERAAGLAAKTLSQDVFRLSVAGYLRLVEVIDTAMDDPAAPLRLVEASSLEVFSPVLFAALCSSDLVRAVTRVAKHKRLVAPMRVESRSTTDGLEVSWMWDDPTIRTPRLLAAIELVAFTQIARTGIGIRVNPLRVTSPVELGADGDYTGFFGTPVVVDDRTSLLFRHSDATREFVRPDHVLWQHFEVDLQRRRGFQHQQLSTADQTRAALLACLPGGELTLPRIARRINMSERTLQRRLRTEGTTLRELVSTTRRRLAQHYLTRTTLPYAEVAFLLGFDTTTSFFRAYRSWTGRTPQSTRCSVTDASGVGTTSGR